MLTKNSHLSTMTAQVADYQWRTYLVIDGIVTDITCGHCHQNEARALNCQPKLLQRWEHIQPLIKEIVPVRSNPIYFVDNHNFYEVTWIENNRKYWSRFHTHHKPTYRD